MDMRANFDDWLVYVYQNLELEVRFSVRILETWDTGSHVITELCSSDRYGISVT